MDIAVGHAANIQHLIAMRFLPKQTDFLIAAECFQTRRIIHYRWQELVIGLLTNCDAEKPAFWCMMSPSCPIFTDMCLESFGKDDRFTGLISNSKIWKKIYVSDITSEELWRSGRFEWCLLLFRMFFFYYGLLEEIIQRYYTIALY